MWGGRHSSMEEAAVITYELPSSSLYTTWGLSLSLLTCMGRTETPVLPASLCRPAARGLKGETSGCQAPELSCKVQAERPRPTTRAVLTPGAGMSTQACPVTLAPSRAVLKLQGHLLMAHLLAAFDPHTQDPGWLRPLTPHSPTSSKGASAPQPGFKPPPSLIQE